jgi:hypothetical protein
MPPFNVSELDAELAKHSTTKQYIFLTTVGI